MGVVGNKVAAPSSFSNILSSRFSSTIILFAEFSIKAIVGIKLSSDSTEPIIKRIAATTLTRIAA